jgi:hypothetical protein
MAFTIGKRVIASAPRFSPTAGAGPSVGQIPKVGSVVTCQTGDWYGHGSPNFKFMWYLGTRSAYASATNQSYSISAADAGSRLTCRMTAGNQKWGSNVVDAYVGTTTVIP